MSKSAKVLQDVFLVNPETEEKLKIVSLRGKESGLDYLEIVTKGKDTYWKHKIYTEEV